MTITQVEIARRTQEFIKQQYGFGEQWEWNKEPELALQCYQKAVSCMHAYPVEQIKLYRKIGDLLKDLQKSDEAIRVYEEVLEISRHQFTEQHKETAQSHLGLAQVHGMFGSARQASKHYDTAFEICQRLPAEERQQLFYVSAEVGDRAALCWLLQTDNSLLSKQDGEGRTVLHIAAASGQFAVCRLLISYRNQLLCKVDYAKQKPHEVVDSKKHPDVFKLLQNAYVDSQMRRENKVAKN